MAILKEERIEAIVNRLTTSTMVTFLPTVKKPRRLLPRSVSRSIHHLEFLSTNRTQEVVLALPRADRSFSKYYSNADESEREKRRSTECVREREREKGGEEAGFTDDETLRQQRPLRNKRGDYPSQIVVTLSFVYFPSKRGWRRGNRRDRDRESEECRLERSLTGASIDRFRNDP